MPRILDQQRRKGIELAKGVTIETYEAWVANQKHLLIANLVYQRFSERYLVPALGPNRHGFSMMAIGCLMVEALESFKQGWPDTRRMYFRPFESFFGSHKDFAVFQGLAEHFYRNVRCGILHQAETTGGWLIERRGPLYEPGSRTINTAQFLKSLGNALTEYRDSLLQADWNSQAWVHLRKKMNCVCENALGARAS